MKLFITIFTPTFNRANLLYRLYQSLCNQTFKDFEWIIVNDGSKDNTDDVVQSFLDEGKIKIKYIKQENGGKHRAINRGVREAKGDFFFIVDADDYLISTALKIVSFYAGQIKDDTSFAGICGMKCYPDMHRIGGDTLFKTIDCTAIDFRNKYRMKGDVAEILKTSILKQYPFPEIKDEKFCPEALVWNTISFNDLKLRYFNENIYIAEYIPNGLTSRIDLIRINSPKSALLTYDITLKNKNKLIFKKWFRFSVNFWRFYFHCTKEKRQGTELHSRLLMPLGFIYYLIDKRKYYDK